MVDEQTIVKQTYLRYISSVPNIQDKKNEESWKQGYAAITNKRLLFFPEKNNKPAETEEMSININDITEIDRKIELWKKIMGASKILPIHHIQNKKETTSLISSSNETITMVKQVLIILVIEGSDAEFVCPFSKGGKILLDKQPMKASLHTQQETIIISSEWLGKKQQELISIPKLDGFEKSSRDDGTVSLILKYQKDGILISTLVTGQKRVINSLEQYIKIVKGITDEIEDVQLDEKQFMLIQMMYTSDIDAAMATEVLEVTSEELKKIVNVLVGHKILKTNNENEVELTELGTKYIVEQMKKNLEGG